MADAHGGERCPGRKDEGEKARPEQMGPANAPWRYATVPAINREFGHECSLGVVFNAFREPLRSTNPATGGQVFKRLL